MFEAGAVDGMAHRKIVGAIKYQVYLTHQPVKQCVIGLLGNRNDIDIGIDGR